MNVTVTQVTTSLLMKVELNGTKLMNIHTYFRWMSQFPEKTKKT
jgi:hypothetical protein